MDRGAEMSARVKARTRATRSAAILLGMAGLVGGWACAPIEPWWRDPPAPRSRSIPKPKPSRGPGAASGSSETPGGAAAAEPAASPADFEGPGFCQVVLLSGSAGGPVPPGLRDAVLGRGQAEAVGELVTVLYPTAGTTGTTHRQTLVYPSVVEAESAREAARNLDVTPVEAPGAQPPAGIERAFAFGVGLYYGTPRGQAGESERLAVAEASLVQALNAPDEPGKRRWAAGMLAGWIRSDRLRDYEKAEVHFEAAGQVVEPNSLERMAALYARSRMAIQNGRPDLARGTLKGLIDTFGASKTTEVFRRARHTLDDLERKRGR